MKEYFSHDHNARHDRKVVALVSKHKSAGYGIFWATNEMMHEEGGELEFDEITFGAIAKHLNEDECFVKEVIKDCIDIFKLYILSGEKLTSNRVKRNITGSEERKLAKSEKAAISGRLGGIKSGESRRSKQTLQANEATIEATKLKKRKEKEREEYKEEKIFKKDFTKFPLAENFNGLPDKKIEASIGLIKATQNVNVSIEKINSFWEVFKIQRLTGENFYENEEKIYEHFINWVKDKKIDNGTSRDQKNRLGNKSGGFGILTEALNKD